MFITVLTSKHGTYPEPDQSSHTLTHSGYRDSATHYQTVVVRTPVGCQDRLWGPPSPLIKRTRRELTSQPIRTVQLYLHFLTRLQQDAQMVSPPNVPASHLLSMLHAPPSTRKRSLAAGHGVLRHAVQHVPALMLVYID
jgi:hypothetical protein